MRTARWLYVKIVREAATHNVCVAVAAVMVLAAGGYLVLAVINSPIARELWAPWAVVEVVLSIWNLLVYIEKMRIRERETGTT